MLMFSSEQLKNVFLHLQQWAKRPVPNRQHTEQFLAAALSAQLSWQISFVSPGRCLAREPSGVWGALTGCSITRCNYNQKRHQVWKRLITSGQPVSQEFSGRWREKMHLWRVMFPRPSILRAHAWQPTLPPPCVSRSSNCAAGTQNRYVQNDIPILFRIWSYSDYARIV